MASKIFVKLKTQLAETRKALTPPQPGDPEVDKKLEDAVKAERRKYGRAATMLTGGAGLLEEPTIARKLLLGA